MRFRISFLFASKDLKYLEKLSQIPPIKVSSPSFAELAGMVSQPLGLSFYLLCEWAEQRGDLTLKKSGCQILGDLTQPALQAGRPSLKNRGTE